MLSTSEIKKRIYCRPLTKGHPASPYASDHGCDWTCREAPVYAIAAGKVYKIYNKGAKRNPNASGTPSWGQYVVIDHGGWCSGYAHLKDFSVTEGQVVKAGQRIATSGNTGRTLGATGMHLHLDIYQSGSMGNRWKSPFGIKGLFYNAPAIKWADGSVGDEDYNPITGEGAEGDAENILPGGIDFTEAVQTLVSSDNWKWLSDNEDKMIMLKHFQMQVWKRKKHYLEPPKNFQKYIK